MGIKGALYRLVHRVVYGSRADSVSYIAYLKNLGISIGEGTVIYDPESTIVDVQNPALLSIGHDVRITAKSVILTHDYSWSVVANQTGECLGGVAPVKIGNNVFIGMSTIILPGITIGDNVIVGAGSIVSRDLPSNSVCVGSPARMIMTLDEFREKKLHSIGNRMEAIKKTVGSNRDQLNSCLREFAFYDDSICSDREKLLRDTGYVKTVCGDSCNENSDVFSG